jgi:hypothetical protein
VTKKKLKKILRAYEDALSVIFKLNGRYRHAPISGDGDQVFFSEEPRFVAGLALARGNEQLYKELCVVPSEKLTVSRKGRLKPARSN